MHRTFAGLLILLLGLALVIALAPFATGLIGIPVLYVLMAPVHRWLARRLGVRAAAAITVTLATVLLVVPGLLFIGLLLGQAQAVASGIADSPLVARLGTLHLGRFELGPYVADLGSKAVTWLGGSALGLIGTATRQVLNLLIALFGLYYLLLRPDETWARTSAYLPFSSETTERLRTRFRGVTASTVIGTGLTAVLQGGLSALAFWIVGLPNALFWGMVTMILGILPVVGSGMVLGPATIVLFMDGRTGAGLFMLVWGVLMIGNVDYLIRPLVFKRWAHIHPVTTLVGAFAGVPYFGILGLLIGPLALSYFFELASVYREEFGPNPQGLVPEASA
jgi:predicted PurR-regulated permease PerM